MTRSGAVHTRRRVGEVLGAGILTCALALAIAGGVDAIVGWGSAAQFVPSFAGRLRYLIYAMASHAFAGGLAGLGLVGGALVLTRLSRLGDILDFLRAEHERQRAASPARAVAGLGITMAALPVLVVTSTIAYRIGTSFLANRNHPGLVLVVAMSLAFGALVAAAPVILLLGRCWEWILTLIARRGPRRARVLSSPYAIAVLLAIQLAASLVTLAIREWETARILPLHGPLVAVGAIAITPIAAYPARRIAVLVGVMLRRLRIAFWIGATILTLVIVLLTGGDAAITKAATSYTGLGGPITRTVRRVFDRDRDTYARFLGGGDCDDGDPTVHPNAPEIPDDGIDQNCVGGDASLLRSLTDVGFVPVPASIPTNFNVVLITIDTTRADHLGMYGYPRPTSPHLDKLARDGTLFEHGWAHAPSTRYSMPAILTGRLPLDVHYDNSVWWPALDAKATTIAETLAPLGFAARGAITNYEYFDKVRKMDQGFLEYDNDNRSLHGGVAGKGPEQTKGSSSKQQTDKAIAFVGKHTAERFFLWVHYYDPHFAYEKHPEVPSFGDDEKALYDNELAFTDLHIGRFLDELRAKGLYDRTVVVVTGDHGEGFGEHDVHLHGYDLYAAQTKVPFVIRVPGVAPRRSTTPAGHTDILPTLANLAGGTATSEMQGRSLVDAIAGTDRDRTIFQQLSYEGNHEKRGAISRGCHVLYNASPDISWEVYRTDLDPNETKDLAATEHCAATREALARWYDLDAVPEGAAEALVSERPPIGKPIDAQLGTSVKLLGVELPAKAKPGETISLTWTFQATGRVAPGWKLFVHLAAPRLVQGDHTPARPFEWWKAGQYIRYTTQLVIPPGTPKGNHALLVGMFKGKDRARATGPAGLAITNNAVTVGTIEVAP